MSRTFTGWQCWRDGFWFRVRGYGINVHRRSTHVPLFSERHGGARWHYVGPVCFRVLRPREAAA